MNFVLTDAFKCSSHKSIASKPDQHFPLTFIKLASTPSALLQTLPNTLSGVVR